MRARLAVLASSLCLTAAFAAQAQVTPGALPARVAGVYTSTGGPVIVLEVVGTSRYLPIWVAQREAEVAEGYIKRRTPPRPLTHDLLRNVIASLGGRVVAVYVSDLQARTFIGRVDIAQGGAVRQLDARSSDAVCTGLATGAPVYVMAHVLAQGGLDRAQLAQQGIFLP